MKTWSFVLACLFSAATSTFAADDPLTVAKDLYAAAAYEDALTTLTKMSDAGGLAPAVSLQLDQYRSFCLIALGRTKDAESVAQGIVKRDPMFELSAEESSPRVEALFAQVRRQLLPGLIRDKYREAKAAVDRKEMADAQALFTDVRRMIVKAQQFGLKDEAMSDLLVLADGFLELARASAPPAKTAAPTAAPAAPAAAEAPIAKAPATPTPSEIFNASSPDVVAPVALRQRVPQVPPLLASLAAKKRGSYDLTIEADGHVSDVVVRESVQNAYDTMIADAAKQWRYKPATKDGVPVRYVKSIAIEVQEE